MIDTTHYEMIARQIEEAFARHGLEVRVGQISVLPAFIDYQLVLYGSTRVAQVRALRDDIALTLRDESVMMRQGDTLSLQVTRKPPTIVRAETLLPKMGEGKYIALLGIDERGNTLTARLSSSEVAHVLIAGTTGSGKTQLARTMISSLVLRHRPHELGIVMIDPKRITSDAFAASISSHLLLPVAHEISSAARALDRIISVMGSRNKPEPRIVIYIDEVADMVIDEGILVALQRIGATGRELGIHLVGCTQKPTAAAVGSLLKANLPLRLVGRVVSASEASTASGMPGCGAERLGGSGDFMAIATGRMVRFQAALPPPLPPPLNVTARVGSEASILAGMQLEEPVIKSDEDELAERVAAMLRDNPGLSLNHLSREATGKPYAGNTHVARFRRIYDRARSMLPSTTTGDSG